MHEGAQIEGVAEEVVFDHLHATAFQHSPLGRTILGPAENIKKLTRDDLADYIATHYKAPRMVRTSAGPISLGGGAGVHLPRKDWVDCIAALARRRAQCAQAICVCTLSRHKPC